MGLFISVTCAQALAWGHQLDLRDPKLRPAYLAPIALLAHEIRFCVSIDPSVASQFDSDSIHTQTQAVLQAWLNPAQQVRAVSSVTLRAVDCKLNRFDLKVVLGPDQKYPQLGSYHDIFTDGARNYSVIHINTEYRTPTKIAIVDYKSLMRLESHDELVASLDRLAQNQGFSSIDFAKYAGLEHDPVFWSTFRILLHEVGHAFGLCDTLSSLSKTDCDPDFLTSISRQTVMSDSTYMSLTKDDEIGIVALFQRLARELTLPSAL